MTELPNILIIYPDQMRYDAMGSAGNPVIKTPNIDRLAMEGVHFAEAYLSFPICCPFRASLITGKYAHGHGMVQNHIPLRGGQTFLAEMLADAGYRTGYLGKMLHDLRCDHHEQNNLVDLAGHAALMDDFDARIAAHMAGTGDDWDMAAEFPPPDFLTHAEAKTYLESELLPNAVVVP